MGWGKDFTATFAVAHSQRRRGSQIIMGRNILTTTCVRHASMSSGRKLIMWYITPRSIMVIGDHRRRTRKSQQRTRKVGQRTRKLGQSSGMKMTRPKGIKKGTRRMEHKLGQGSLSSPLFEPDPGIEGWSILVTGVHEEAQEDDLQNAFGESGDIKNLHLNLDRPTGFVKGYALIEYEKFEEPQKAIAEINGDEILEQTVSVDWAFCNGPSTGPFKRKNARHWKVFSNLFKKMDTDSDGIFSTEKLKFGLPKGSQLAESEVHLVIEAHETGLCKTMLQEYAQKIGNGSLELTLVGS